VLTVGVDLAANPAGTAVASVEWLAGRAVVRDVLVEADDSAVVAVLAQADKAGIDCPLGWPDAFVAFVAAHQHGQITIPRSNAGQHWRRPLTMRLTDLVIKQETGVTPLSVSADRLGHVAMRCAGLLAMLAQKGQVVDRSGGGMITEVYPAASLKVWGMPYRGYKRPGDMKTLVDLIDCLLAAAPWLDLGDADMLCRRTHHVVDAVVAALTARAADRNLTLRPRTTAEEAAASTEGWVAIPLPTSELGQLP
jgi:predicted nuclease with RNAse H fold